MREEAGLTQRDLGKKLRKPQSWVYNCETANRRVDVTEFANWCKECGADPLKTFADAVGYARGGQTAAILASACHRHGIDVLRYLTQLLTNLADSPTSKLDQWLPDQWKPTTSTRRRQRPCSSLIAHDRSRPIRYF